MRTHARLAVVLLAASLAAGCGALRTPATPDITRLHLDGGRAEVSRAAESVPRSILVASPRAAPGYSTPRFAYMQRSRELAYYGRHEWTAEPARMLQPAVTDALDRSARFAAVVAAPSPAVADLRLELEVVRLVHDYRSGDGAIMFAVRAQLVDLADRRVLASRLFEYREPAGTGPVRGAAAADRAFGRLLADLVDFCIEHSDG